MIKVQTVKVQPVILCGGSGTRLWPLSRTGFPKQFLCLSGNSSLFQQAAQRLTGLSNETYKSAAPIIVTGEEHRFFAQEQLREIGQTMASYLLEPEGRNTAPALTLAALAALEGGDDPVLVVTPADQTVTDSAAFACALQTAIAKATQGHIVIFGVTPDKPDTGFGYIQTNLNTDFRDSDESIQVVNRFVEKPNAETAEKYIEEGNYFWNAGIFVLKASVWLEALYSFREDIKLACIKVWGSKKQDGNFIRFDKDLFSQVPSESIDFAVLEKCPGSKHNIRMVSLNAGWNDLGTWESVWNISPKDNRGNVKTGHVITHNSNDSLVHSSGRLVAMVGVNNLVVVETKDAVLVVNKYMSQDIKNIMVELSMVQNELLIQHSRVIRPWGWYENLEEGDNFKVKRIHVHPGASLSLQKHNHRAEHWIVVRGKAKIINSGKIINLKENESTYIPKNSIHRLTNNEKKLLEIIEIQTGNYLGEDDIVRIEDKYGRIN